MWSHSFSQVASQQAVWVNCLITGKPPGHTDTPRVSSRVVNPRGARRLSNMYVVGESVFYYAIGILDSKTVASGICGRDHRAAPHRSTPHRTAPHRIAPHCTGPHRIASHCAASHRTASHRAAPHKVRLRAQKARVVWLASGRATTALSVCMADALNLNGAWPKCIFLHQSCKNMIY